MLKELIMITKQELEAGLKAVAAQQGKIAKEQSDRFDALTAKIKALQDALDASDVPQGVEDAFNELKTAAQALDDVVPDAPPA